MASEKLKRRGISRRSTAPYVPEEERPKFHVTGGIGWINDPNGFSLYKGEYHLFHQYHPYKPIWGPMHWGHVKTRDFIRWERLPVALAPDMPYDKDGCFSGSAVELPDGRQLLMYTGVREERQADGSLKPFQTQCLAVGDGVTPGGRQRFHTAFQERGRLPLGISGAGGFQPQPVRQDVGVPGFLPAGRQGRAAGQPPGDEAHRAGVPRGQRHRVHDRRGGREEAPDPGERPRHRLRHRLLRAPDAADPRRPPGHDRLDAELGHGAQSAGAGSASAA